MDRSVKKDITRRYNALDMKDGKGHTDTFLCQQCGHPIRTVQADNGVVPMGIECPYCNGEAMHQDEDNGKLPITHEWYKPALEEVLRMAEENKLFSVTMILNGGLLRREVP